MSRIEPVDRETLSPRQQALYDSFVKRRPRPTLSGPFAVWIHTPEIAEPTDQLANHLRFRSGLDQRLIELVVLLMCRDASVNYAWSVHVPLARKAGLSEAMIEAIRARRRPQFEREDETVVYELVTELAAAKSLRDATFERAKQVLGRDGLIEVVSCAGFYGMVGLLLNAFDVPPQGEDVLG